MKKDETCNENIENDYLKIYKKHIKQSLSQTALQERADLEQELYIKIFQKMKSLNFREEAPSFWDFFTKDD
ncbi:hypothetical protein [Lysinibacillus sp. RC79]|uniref:hypothetical protein n=1 Tax=Lysinibacillus sp. RC79 TaxID=3156296 RepID=UPI003513F346